MWQPPFLLVSCGHAFKELLNNYKKTMLELSPVYCTKKNSTKVH